MTINTIYIYIHCVNTLRRIYLYCKAATYLANVHSILLTVIAGSISDIANHFCGLNSFVLLLLSQFYGQLTYVWINSPFLMAKIIIVLGSNHHFSGKIRNFNPSRAHSALRGSRAIREKSVARVVLGVAAHEAAEDAASLDTTGVYFPLVNKHSY